MGCCVLSLINQKPLDITGNTEKNDNDEEERRKQKNGGITITPGLILNESKDNPYNVYETLDNLGEGGFGQVVKVRHKISKEIRAMKVIHKDQIQTGSEVDLIKEINILKTLDHPNIMKVFEYYNYKNCLFIISELLSGGELFDKINENKFLKEDVCAYLMKQIFSAVNFCHEKNIIHRDLKPENVLIESKEEPDEEFFTVKLIDFGTSDKIKKGQNLNLQVGTPYYTAPEVLNNNYNEKCDLWS